MYIVYNIDGHKLTRSFDDLEKVCVGQIKYEKACFCKFLSFKEMNKLVANLEAVVKFINNQIHILSET